MQLYWKDNPSGHLAQRRAPFPSTRHHIHKGRCWLQHTVLLLQLPLLVLHCKAAPLHIRTLCALWVVLQVCPYRWSKAGQLLLALALRFSSGLVPLLYLLLYLCLKPPTHKHVFSTCHEGHHNNNNNKPLKEVIQRQRLRYENQVTKGNRGFTVAPFVCVCRAPNVGYRWEDKRKVSYIDSCATTPTSLESMSRLKVALSLTPLVVFAVLRVSLHAVVQFHQDRFQTGVHPLDQLMVHHQWPQQNAQRWKAAWRMNMGFFVVVVLITALTPIITHCQTPSVMAHL